MVKTCFDCGSRMKVQLGTMPDGVPYEFYKCVGCGEEVLDMKQLDTLADKYRNMKKYRVKLSTWGQSTGMRIPKELAKKYKFKKEVTIIPEENGILVLPG